MLQLRCTIKDLPKQLALKYQCPFVSVLIIRIVKMIKAEMMALKRRHGYVMFTLNCWSCIYLAAFCWVSAVKI